MVLESHEALARTIAARIRDVINERRAAGARPVLGLATGSTPIGVYRELIRMHREEGLSFRGVVTFNLDEYWPMAPESIHSYRRFMQENLFDHIDIDPADTSHPRRRAAAQVRPRACAGVTRPPSRPLAASTSSSWASAKTGHIGFNEPGSGMRRAAPAWCSST